MLAKLANAYVRAGGDDEKAARILGVAVGSAGRPKDGTSMRQQRTVAVKPPRRPQGARQLACIASVTRC